MSALNDNKSFQTMSDEEKISANDEFFSDLADRYAVLDRRESEYKQQIEGMLANKIPFDDIRMYFHSDDMKKVWVLNGEMIHLYRMLDIAEKEEYIGETPVLRSISRISEIENMIISLQMIIRRIEFEMDESLWVMQLGDILDQYQLSPLFLLEFIVNWPFVRKRYICESIASGLNKISYTPMYTTKFNALVDMYERNAKL